MRSIIAAGMTLPVTMALLVSMALAATSAAAAPSDAGGTPAPQVTAAPSPKSDDLQGGNRVTVTGAGFTGVVAVSFGDAAGTDLSVTSPTSLQITAPAHAAGDVDVRIATTHGSSAVVAADRFRYVAPPVVTAVSPAAGRADSGVNGGRSGDGYVVRVHGTDFADLGTHLRGIYFGRPGTTPDRAQYVTYAARGADYVSVFAPSAPAGTVDVSVVTDYGTSAAVAADNYTYVAPTDRSVTYQQQTIPQTQGGYVSVSCASSTFCLGLDGYGNAARYNGSSWSALTAVEARVSQSPRTFVASCAAPTFCVVFDPYGNAITTADGRSFSAPHPVASGAARPTAVSCALPTYCLATSAARDVYRYDGRTWSAPTELSVDDGDGSGLAAISCSSPTFCLAGTGTAGHVLRYDGTTWTAAGDVGNYGFQSIDCSSHLRCVLVTDTDIEPQTAVVYSGAGSTLGATQDLGGGCDDDVCYSEIVSASCGATDSCVAVSDEGESFTFDGDAWAEHYDHIGGSSVSCTSATFCLASSNERARTYDGRAWSALSLVAPEVRTNSVSCPTTTFCAGLSQFGASVSFLSDSTWGTPRVLDQRINDIAFPPSVSCASVSFCVDVFRFGAFVWNGTAWSAAGTIDDRHLTHVSCSSATFCAALDSAGRALIFDGTAWSRPVTLAGGAPITSVSCAGGRFCAATYGGDIVMYSAGRWSGPQRVTGPLDLSTYADPTPQVSCTSATFCVSINGYQASMYDGSGWSPAYGLTTEATHLVELSCASPTFCAATGLLYGISGFVFDGTAWSGQHDGPAFGRDPSRSTGLSCAAAGHCVLGVPDYTSASGSGNSFRGSLYFTGS